MIGWRTSRKQRIGGLLGAGALGGLLALAGAGGTDAPAPSPSARAPHVVLVTLDTLRADRCSAYGYGRPTTPHLDAVASQGVRFESAYAVSATTLPAHASIFTALAPGEHGVVKNGFVLSDEVTTMAERFAAAGYATAAFVSSFVVERRFGTAQGFEVYDDDFTGADSSFGLSRKAWEGHRLEAPYDRRAGDTTQHAVRWLAERSDSRPLFLWVHYFDPHAPYDPPEPYRSRFLRPEAKGQARQRDLYDGDVRYTDEQLGHLLTALEGAVSDAEMLLVLVGDHGEGLWDHGWQEHGVHLYEEAVRVPLVVRWTGRIPAGRSLPGLVSQVDLLPTLLALAGIEPGSAPMRGRDLSGLVRGDALLDADRAVFMQRRLYQTPQVQGLSVAGPKWAIRWRHWKLIAAPLEGEPELYDLARDPHETHDVAARFPDSVARLQRRLAAWQASQPQEQMPAAPAPNAEVRERLEALGYVE